MKRIPLGIALLAVFACFAAGARAADAPKDKPAILLAAFGTSTKAQSTYDVFEKQLREVLPGYEVRWAFTSQVIRGRVNAKREKEGDPRRLLSVREALEALKAEGWAKVAVQPLHIFPGEEYEEVVAEARGFPGLKVELGETLLHRWESVREVAGILSRDFLPEAEGCNVVVAHGSPQTASASNIAVLGLDRHLAKGFPNVYLGCVEGIVTRQEALAAAKAHAGKRVRLLPLMFVGGDHVMNDLMGEDDGSAEPSWKAELVRAGKTVDTPETKVGGETQYRGLGLIPEINKIFIRETERALARL